MGNKAGMSLNLGLPVSPEVDNPELYSALSTVFNAIKNLGYGLDSYTGNTPLDPADYAGVNAYGFLQVGKTAVVFAKLTEAVTQGSMINLYNSGGLRARKAIVSSQPCQGFAGAKGEIGDTIPICLFGLCTYIGGLTPGTVYYMSGTAGLITSGATAQKLGIALGPNQLWFNPA